MDVAVDQAGQHRGVRQVDQARARRRRDSHRGDAVVLDPEGDVLPVRFGEAVEEPPRLHVGHAGRGGEQQREKDHALKTSSSSTLPRDSALELMNRGARTSRCSKPRVELAHPRCRRVGEQEPDAAPVQGDAGPGQALLIVPGEPVGGVAGEAGGGGDGVVGRIEIDEVAGGRLDEGVLEGRVQDVDAFERLAGVDQRRRMVEARVLVAPDRHVEPAGSVHPPEPVEAGLVEIDEPGSAFGRFQPQAARAPGCPGSGPSRRRAVRAPGGPRTRHPAPAG